MLLVRDFSMVMKRLSCVNNV